MKEKLRKMHNKVKTPIKISLYIYNFFSHTHTFFPTYNFGTFVLLLCFSWSLSHNINLLLLLLLRCFSRVRLCDPIDGSPPRSPIPGILQARILEWVAISLSKYKPKHLKNMILSFVLLFYHH